MVEELATPKQETLSPKRIGWWNASAWPESERDKHTYRRLDVENYVTRFVGWRALKQLINAIPLKFEGVDGKGRDIYSELYHAFFAILFLTGGRLSECLLLKRRNIIIKENLIYITQMRLLKKYKKVGETVDGEGKKHWQTQKLVKYRPDFTIQRREPFTEILVKWVSRIQDPDAYLFASPYEHHRHHDPESHLLVNKRVNPSEGGKPYTPVWAYQVLRSVSRSLSEELKDALGLKQPLLDDSGKDVGFWDVDENGKKVLVKGEIHLWVHWMRSQRASQLVHDYGFKVEELVEYFKWTDLETALIYAHMGTQDLTDKMSKAKVTYT
jgi:hypothetical protein